MRCRMRRGTWCNRRMASWSLGRCVSLHLFVSLTEFRVDSLGLCYRYLAYLAHLVNPVGVIICMYCVCALLLIQSDSKSDSYYSCEQWTPVAPLTLA
jgi:hypothetical protein